MKALCLGCMQEFDDEYRICPHCGYAVGTTAEEAIHIQPGTRLHNRYIIGKVLGFGGFGVTYIAWDERLEQRVAIKEYLPSEFSTRMPGQTQVTVFNGEKSQQFYDGLSKFVDEAKRLAKFQNESGIVRIFDSFEDNSTAYIVMEYLKGETLAGYMERMGPLDEQDAVAMLMPIMESLQAVHTEGIIHRDIAPDNIFLTDDGEIKLIDFGASRYATTSHSRSLTVVIKQGYSPEEQYRSRGDHGPHTDVYALSATLYKMITGKTPPDAMERRVEYETKRKDILVEPHKLNKKISRNRENAILNALNVRIEDRTPNIAAFIDELNADPPAKRIYGKIKLIDRLRWPLWLKITVPAVFAIVLTMAILLLSGVINFSKFSQNIFMPDGVVVVPEVEGLNTEEAIDLITNGNLLASTDGTIESQYIPAGIIILQTPTGGSYMNINGTVSLVVGSGKGVESSENGMATVPYVIWETKEDAIAKLLQAGLGEPEIIERNDDNVSAGAVIAQSVNAGEEVDEGTQITLTVSLGPVAFALPDFVGQTKEEAESILTSLGLIVVMEYQKDDTVKEGTVLAQNKANGSSVQRGDVIVLTVSTDTKTNKVASVVGKDEVEAESILKQQGFKVTVLENYDDSVAAGKVISQSPQAGVEQIPGSEIILYVSKGKQPITITFNADGGTVNPGSKVAYLSDFYGSLPTPSKDGYTFNGWFSAKSGGLRVSESTKVTTPSSHSLYAVWTPNVYTVTFDSNGGGAAPSPKKVTYGSAYGTLNSATRSGYTFIGWFTERDGGREVLADTTYTITSNQTLYAHWSENGYTVNFDATGGSVTSASKNVVYGSTYGALPVPTRDGYIFDGWYTASSGGNKVESSTKVSITSEQTLYAHWTKIVVTDISIATKPSITEYFAGEILNTSGLTLTVKYSDGSSKTVSSGYSCSPTSFSSSGSKTITVTYEGKTATFNVNVKTVEISLLAIKSKPSKTSYYVGDTLNTSGLSLTAAYNNGTTKTISSGFSCSPTTLSSSGTKTITVTYGGQSTSFTVIVEDVTVSSVSIKSKPSKTSYYVGDTLNTSGLTLTAKYNNGTTKTISSGFSCSPTTLSSSGTKTITVTYGGQSTSFTVSVSDVTVSSIAIKSKPTKTTYYVGDSLNTSGLTLTVNYNNGTTKTVSSGFTCSPTTLSSSGTKTITVTYGGKTATFTVSVENRPMETVNVSSIAIKSKPTKTSYYVSDTLNTSGLTLTVKYDNGTTETISSGFTCSPTSFSSAGTKTITVTYGGKSTSFTVNVVEAPISSIAIKSKPTKTSYSVGDTLNTSGLTLTATYNNGTTKTISSGFTCSPTSFTSAGSKTITVTYEGKTTSFTVNVAEVTVSSIAVKSKPTKTTYYVGDSLNTSGLTLTVNYTNGTQKIVSSGFSCSPTTLSSSGTKTITVTYEGKTTTFTVSVNNDSIVSMSSTSGSFKVLDTGVTITDYSSSVYVGNSIHLSVSHTWDQTPKTFTVKTNSAATKITASSSNTNIVTVSVSQTGNVATITVTPSLIDYNVTKTATVYVNLNGTQKATYSASVYRPHSLTVTSSDKKIIYVNGDVFGGSGDLYAVGTDSTWSTATPSNIAYLTVTTHNGNTDKCRITVKSPSFTTNTVYNIRSGPGTGYSPVTSVGQGVTLTVYGHYWDGTYIWGYVNYNGKWGWIAQFKYSG